MHMKVVLGQERDEPQEWKHGRGSDFNGERNLKQELMEESHLRFPGVRTSVYLCVCVFRCALEGSRRCWISHYMWHRTSSILT